MNEYDVKIVGYVRVEAETAEEARLKVTADLGHGVYVGDTLVEYEVAMVDEVQA